MGQRLKFGFALLCLLGAAGCSSIDADPDPNGTVSGFCGNWAKAACSNSVVLACSGADKVDASLTDACVMSQRVFCEGLLPAKGYSSQKATQCLSAVQKAYSDARLTAAEIATVRHRGDPCNHLIKGTQDQGEKQCCRGRCREVRCDAPADVQMKQTQQTEWKHLRQVRAMALAASLVVC